MSSTLDYSAILAPWKTQGNFQRKCMKKACGIYFWDDKNKKYFDMASQCVYVNIGHSNQTVISSIKAQLDTLPYCYSEFITPIQVDASNRILQNSPGYEKIFFTSSGSEANENAIKISRIITKKQKIFSAYQSFHGATIGAGNLSGDARRFACEPGVGFVKFNYPFPYRAPIRFDTEKEVAQYYLQTLEHQILAEGAHTIAAIFVEPITGSSGGIIPPDGYMQGLRKLCTQYNILLVSDEVLAGCGRTGRWFALSHWNVEADIVTMAKGLTSGYFPFGAVLLHEKYASVFDQQPLMCGSTNYAHPIGCAAVCAVLDTYKNNHLFQHTQKMEFVLNTLLNQLQERYAYIGDVRCKGLLCMLEFVEDHKTKKPLTNLSSLKTSLESNGFWTLFHSNMMLIAPPLIITEEELKRAISILEHCLSGFTF